MQGSILIFGGNKNKREEKIIEIVNSEESKTFEKINDLFGKPDIHVITLEDKEKSISISQTRNGASFLREKPFSYKKKFLIIIDAEKMTAQAQNSLLKTLEEPPTYSVIILSSKTQQSLLGTIVSRCKIINIKTENDEEDSTSKDYASLKNVLKMSRGERLDACLELSKEEKEDTLDMLDKWVEQGRADMIKNPKDMSKMTNLKRILSVKKDLENSNVNVRLSLEALVLSLS